MTVVTRVVFDCNVFLQALASPDGPAGQCVQFAIAGKVSLFVSPVVLDELREVASRPKVIERLKIGSNRAQAFIECIELAATVLVGFPEPFKYARDPDDAHYVNLAIAADARLIVARDKDLLDLMDSIQPESRWLRARYPQIRIVDPVAFLLELKGSLESRE